MNAHTPLALISVCPQEMHGFICPECSADLKSAEALQAHYLKAHAQIIHEDDVCRSDVDSKHSHEQATSSEDEDAHRKPAATPAKVREVFFLMPIIHNITTGPRNATAPQPISISNTKAHAQPCAKVNTR